MAVIIAVLLALLLTREDESDSSDDPDTVATVAPGGAATPADELANRFVPDGCWSADERVTPESAAGNVAQYPQWSAPPEMVIDEGESYQAVITTNKGEMVFDLNAEAAPQAVNNFICLATNDYYDVTPFHRVIEGFMIQGGDPTGSGGGGPGYQFDDELPGDDLSYDKGTLAMANAGPNTQGSQFFIVHQDLSDEQLQKNYTIFGQLVEGESVLDDIADSAVVPNPRGEPSVPVEFVVIEDVTITIAS